MSEIVLDKDSNKKFADSIRELLENKKSVAKTFTDILKGNPWHDPTNGRFTTAQGGVVATGSTFTPAKTIAEAREYAKTKLGFSGTVDFSYSYIDQKTIQQVSGTLDIDTVNHINKTITEIQEKHPDLKGYVKNMVCTQANVYAQVVHNGRDATATLAIGAKNYREGVESVNQKYLEDVDLGYHPKGTDGNAILWHEYGHVYAATKNIESCGQYATARAKLGAINNNVAESGWLNAATKKMMSDPKAKLECEKLGIDFTEQSVSSSFAKNISRYASMDNAELFAEAFAAENTGHGNRWTKALMEASGA